MTPSSLSTLHLQPASLTFNCRNTGQIARYAYGLIDAEPKLRQGTPEGLDVAVERCADEHQMVDAVRRALHTLVAGGLPPSRIIVLSPFGPNRSAVWRAGTFGNLRLVEFPKVSAAGQVQFATLQRFKGLEADAVVLCEVDRAHRAANPQNLYVAASRARHVLVVVEHGAPA
jgi:hypothetical protein